MALFGIKRIQYCKATQLAFSGQNNPFLGIASEPTNTFTDIVCMVNSRATLTIEQAVVNKQIVYTAKLQFVTPADPMLDVDHYAFIATTNEGERILLGANTRPQVAVVTAQGVFGNAGELTAYTTTAEFKADYRPLRLPVTAAEPISGPAYDICCGQIPQPTAPDTREFDICCGQIKTSEPISGPEYDICCGEIQGEVPEPPHEDITVYVTIQFRTVPTDFAFWQSNDYYNADARRISGNTAVASQNPHTFEFPFIWSQRNPADRYDRFKIYYEIKPTYESETYGSFNRDTDILAADWSALNAAINCTPIYNANHVQVGYYMPEYRGIIGPPPVPDN